MDVVLGDYSIFPLMQSENNFNIRNNGSPNILADTLEGRQGDPGYRLERFYLEFK
jgi:hypothetical protein